MQWRPPVCFQCRARTPVVTRPVCDETIEAQRGNSELSSQIQPSERDMIRYQCTWVVLSCSGIPLLVLVMTASSIGSRVHSCQAPNIFGRHAVHSYPSARLHMLTYASFYLHPFRTYTSESRFEIEAVQKLVSGEKWKNDCNCHLRCSHNKHT